MVMANHSSHGSVFWDEFPENAHQLVCNCLVRWAYVALRRSRGMYVCPLRKVHAAQQHGGPLDGYQAIKRKLNCWAMLWASPAP